MLVYALFALFTGVIAGMLLEELIEKILFSVIAAVVVFLVCITFLPTINFNFLAPYLIIAAMVFLSLIIAVNENVRAYIITFVAIACALCTLLFATLPIFRSKAYHEILKVTNVSDSMFVNKIKAIDVKSMVSVDKQFALKYANSLVGNIPGLGSRVEVVDAFRQTLNGTLVIDGKDVVFQNQTVWVAPLEHRSFFKWFYNGHTPGYIIVDATQENKAYLVTNLNNEDLELKYLESAFWMADIERYLKYNGYVTSGLNDIDFEIDNSGRPYQVVTTYKPTIGFGGKVANGVVTIDVQTGDIKHYPIDEAPEWIERIQPAEFIREYVDDYGKYVHGFWNTVFSETDVIRAGNQVTIIDDADNSYWYVSLVSANSHDDSSCGFMLVDTRTKEAYRFDIPGINEVKAENIIEGIKMDGTQVNATSPIPYNIYGIPTYFMTLRSAESGEFIGYALCSRQDRTCYAIGKTREEVENLYIKTVRNKGNKINSFADSDETGNFIVQKVCFENGKYFFIFNEISDIEFSVGSDVSKELKWSETGDTVKISYRRSDDNTYVVSKFNNTKYHLDLD